MLPLLLYRAVTVLGRWAPASSAAPPCVPDPPLTSSYPFLPDRTKAKYAPLSLYTE